MIIITTFNIQTYMMIDNNTCTSSFLYTFAWVMVCCQLGWPCMLVSSCSYLGGGLMLQNFELVMTL